MHRPRWWSNHVMNFPRRKKNFRKSCTCVCVKSVTILWSMNLIEFWIQWCTFSYMYRDELLHAMNTEVMTAYTRHIYNVSAWLSLVPILLLIIPTSHTKSYNEQQVSMRNTQLTNNTSTTYPCGSSAVSRSLGGSASLTKFSPCGLQLLKPVHSTLRWRCLQHCLSTTAPETRRRLH